MFRRIMVPVDYSENARASLKFAAALAQSVGASIDVVHVWDKPTYVSDAVMVKRPGQEHSSLLALIQENAEHDMNQFLASVELPPGVNVGHRLCSGDTVSTLIAEVQKGEHDLLVLGTHGRTGLAHMLLGSVTEKLIRMSPVPVLTVPPRRP
jgi:nucleotide-binding universal stress UspA family protein